jgi:hypothetical protein
MRNRLLAFVMVAISLGFMMAEKAAFKGSVSISGSPIKDIDVTLKKVPGYSVFSRSEPNTKGVFEFMDVPEGNFVVETSYFPLPTGSESIVSGRFYYFDDALDDAVVKIFNEDNQLIKTLTTDSKGKFTASNLDAAEIKIIISGISGYTP